MVPWSLPLNYELQSVPSASEGFNCSLCGYWEALSLLRTSTERGLEVAQTVGPLSFIIVNCLLTSSVSNSDVTANISIFIVMSLLSWIHTYQIGFVLCFMEILVLKNTWGLDYSLMNQTIWSHSENVENVKKCISGCLTFSLMNFQIILRASQDSSIICCSHCFDLESKHIHTY